MKNPFSIDWTDLEQVIAFAKQLGPGQVVVKHPDRNNYNITFANCPTRYKQEEVVYKT